MSKTEAWELVCPHCRAKTLVPVDFESYPWKSENRHYAKGEFRCIVCEGPIHVKAHREITNVEVM